MVCAHINKEPYKEQSVNEHLHNVGKMSKKFCSKISLEATGELVGILHDMGKETNKFDNYIHYSASNPDDKSLRGTINHSTAGAKYIYDKFYNTKNQFQKFTAQLIALAICSHHGGLVDCLDLKGIDIFTKRIETDKDILYEEALSNYKTECFELEYIDNLFNRSMQEIKTIFIKINSIDDNRLFGEFAAGMLEKYLFSCVIDADRYDTYTFMEGIVPKVKFDKSALWGELADKLENELKSYPKSTKIDLLRKEISISCKDFAKNKPGVYKLAVPTGGGKTLSSLRYALNHAKIFNKDRIFYIIPFTTIIDQNAKEIKNILKRDDIILEHHSNLVVDNQQEDYKLLTERWNSPIILTTMVQFLDTLFSGGTQGVRRMHNLANSIIIFDEIQAIPIKCINMFNSAMNFLSSICKVTIILCTATQPLLDKIEIPIKLSENPNIIYDVNEKFRQFKRVELSDKRILGGYSTILLKEFILERIKDFKSVLVILNTKNSAKAIFNELKTLNDKLPKEKQYYLFHLSTNMCPSHRIEIMENMKKKLGDERVICISTQLIEAGVNISFECVIRSIAGFDSITQAAGRCNRHGEKPCGKVFIVNLEEENVNKLVDIKAGQECTKRVLDEFKENPDTFDNDLLSPKVMERYYEYYFYDRKKEMNYTLSKPNKDKTMYDLLSENNDGSNEFESRNGYKSELMLKQAFKTAGNNFRVIDQNTTGVIVPYGEGRKLITLINGECNLAELKQYLKSAQQFSVNLFKIEKEKIEERKGIVELANGGVLALREGFYKNDVGVTVEDMPMEFLDC